MSPSLSEADGGLTGKDGPICSVELD